MALYALSVHASITVAGQEKFGPISIKTPFFQLLQKNIPLALTLKGRSAPGTCLGSPRQTVDDVKAAGDGMDFPAIFLGYILLTYARTNVLTLTSLRWTVQVAEDSAFAIFEQPFDTGGCVFYLVLTKL